MRSTCLWIGWCATTVSERPGVHLPVNFQLIDAPWEARALATLIANYEAALPPDALAELGTRQP